MSLLYLIDGYNVMHQCTLLRPLALQNYELGRDALIERVARWCTETGETARIVFDGRGRRAEPAVAPRGVTTLEITYSPGHQSADALIERFVYQSKSRRDLVVVSGDRGIRDLCSGLGSLTMEPNYFLTTIDEAVRNARHDLSNRRNVAKRDTLEDRLDPSTLSALQNLRDQLDKKK